MLATAQTFTLDGISARPVQVEVDVHRGLPAFSVVGLPDAAVREARERVRAALVNCGFEFPLRRIVANLAPASLRKAGPGLDLAISVALLTASGQLELERGSIAMVGELALDGSVRPVPGVLAAAEAAREHGCAAIVVPAENGAEAALVDGLEVIGLESLGQVEALAAGEWTPPRPRPMSLDRREDGALPDLADLRGQRHLRYALEVAAAGGHSMLMVGPPGAGKSLAASRLPSILPPLTADEALEVARIASVCGRLGGGGVSGRPFRSPHHTISPAGLIGGGNPPGPGEATLAHRGVLFLDELCEFRRDTLEALRAPLESGWVAVARAGAWRQLPCRFMLVAASNPCPCGRGESDPECSCAPLAVQRYQARLSGALADRIDVLAAIRQPSAEEIGGPAGEPSATVRERVIAARERQESRLGTGRSNAEMTAAEVRECALEESRHAARRVLRPPSPQRPGPRPRPAPVPNDCRSSRQRDDRPRADRPSSATAAKGQRVSEPNACLDCLRRARLLAHLAPYIEKISSAAPGSRSPELLRLSNEDLAAAAAPKIAVQVLGEVEAVPERRLRADLLAARCWACCRHDPAFPPGLYDAADAPWALIGRGDPGLLGRLEPQGTVTIVGARRASAYGREMARELARELAAAGLLVISGLAFGIDACAHRGALDADTTIAVLGCGADIAYPASHRSLWRRICERGLVLSELPPGTGPWRWTFPARNRIMAALAGMTVVVEAAQRSGSLITADLAADLGRDLGAVPGPVNSRASAGTNDLLAGGACLIRDGQDVLDAMLGPGVRRAERIGADLAARLREVLTVLERGAETSDAIAAALELDGAEAASALATLEALGYVSCSLVGVYSRTLLQPPPFAGTI